MKRLLLAAGLAVAALSLPATAALADGYVQRPVAKPKPKAKPAPKHHAKAKVKHHAPKQAYAAANVSAYSMEKYERTETTYYQGSGHHSAGYGHSYQHGPVTTYYSSTVAPHMGCYPERPCQTGWSSGGHHPTVGVSPAFHHGGHPGGVGFGVDGGPVYSGPSVVFVPRAGVPAHQGFGAAHGYYGGQSYGHGSASAHSSASAYSHGSAYGRGGGYGHGAGHGSGYSGYGFPGHAGRR
jgi:hypothetical protein